MFSRCSDRKQMNKCSFVLEMQLFLHPNFKRFDGFLKQIILFYNVDRNGASTPAGEGHFAKIKKIIYDKIRSLMLAVATMQATRTITTEEIDNMPPAPASLFSEDLMELFSDVIEGNNSEDQGAPDVNEMRIDEELERWETSTTSLLKVDKRTETILEYWKRHPDSGAYKFLPLVVRIMSAIPSSSAQVERDFGTTGQLVTPQRGSIAPHNVDMSTFLNCNRQYVDVTQCPTIRKKDIDLHTPSNVKVGLEDDDAEG